MVNLGLQNRIRTIGLECAFPCFPPASVQLCPVAQDCFNQFQPKQLAKQQLCWKKPGQLEYRSIIFAESESLSFPGAYF